MVRRETRSWLLLASIALILATGADFSVFAWRQRRGDVLSFTTVREYVAVPEGIGHWREEYFGTVDVPCVVALLPHQSLKPCWWVSVRRDHWM